ncbi:Jerky [Chionoecetes opilio]|uniref:Jerky n=1 Tax=Chionoecetes opilio TaxID=41210 RepID=A0A8J4YN09_CHIOP|nr:Jerky [Chionoecetes opilio]
MWCANRWISEQVDQRKSNVDGVAIREKARSIYDHLAEKEPSGSSPAPGFIASHGWFHRFKQRESGSADKEGAQAYLSTFKSLIEDSDYLPEQVFNADETGLFYKKMGNRT